MLTAAKGQPAVGTLALRKGGTAQHTYSLSTNQSWIWMNPPYGSTQSITTETDQLVITAQTAALPAGTHSAVVYIVESGPNNFRNMLRIPVMLTVTASPVSTPPPPAARNAAGRNPSGAENPSCRRRPPPTTRARGGAASAGSSPAGTFPGCHRADPGQSVFAGTH
jgi:hypothetical protein